MANSGYRKFDCWTFANNEWDVTRNEIRECQKRQKHQKWTFWVAFTQRQTLLTKKLLAVDRIEKQGPMKSERSRRLQVKKNEDDEVMNNNKTFHISNNYIYILSILVGIWKRRLIKDKRRHRRVQGKPSKSQTRWIKMWRFSHGEIQSQQGQHNHSYSWLLAVLINVKVCELNERIC
jgi:hypothetical protein